MEVGVRVTKQPVPKRPPMLKDFVLVLATLGGHNGRRHARPPGAECLWRAVTKMHHFADAWEAFGPDS